jgi:hypothetical protein
MCEHQSLGRPALPQAQPRPPPTREGGGLVVEASCWLHMCWGLPAYRSFNQHPLWAVAHPAWTSRCLGSAPGASQRATRSVVSGGSGPSADLSMLPEAAAAHAGLIGPCHKRGVTGKSAVECLQCARKDMAGWWGSSRGLASHTCCSLAGTYGSRVVVPQSHTRGSREVAGIP